MPSAPGFRRARSARRSRRAQHAATPRPGTSAPHPPARSVAWLGDLETSGEPTSGRPRCDGRALGGIPGKAATPEAPVAPADPAGSRDGGRGVAMWPLDQSTKTKPPIPTISEIASAPASGTQLPPTIEGWNWGAFWLTWIWGIRNRVWISLLALIPVVGIVMHFVLGAKGT